MEYLEMTLHHRYKKNKLQKELNFHHKMGKKSWTLIYKGSRIFYYYNILKTVITTLDAFKAFWLLFFCDFLKV